MSSLFSYYTLSCTSSSDEELSSIIFMVPKDVVIFYKKNDLLEKKSEVPCAALPVTNEYCPRPSYITLRKRMLNDESKFIEVNMPEFMTNFLAYIIWEKYFNIINAYYNKKDLSQFLHNKIDKRLEKNYGFATSGVAFLLEDLKKEYKQECSCFTGFIPAVW